MICYGVCALKPLNFYEDKCPYCRGHRGDSICYITGPELKRHLQDFNDIFLPKLEVATHHEENQLEALVI